MAKESRESKSEEAQILIKEQIDPNDFLVEDFSEAEERRLFDFLQTRVHYSKGKNGDLGSSDFKVFQTDSGNLIIDPKIKISKDYFTVEGKDYSDLIPVIIMHECYEIWVRAKIGYALTDDDEKSKDYEIAHQWALRREFEYAFKIGKEKKYMDFLRKSGNNDSENLKAYAWAKKMHKREIAKSKQDKSAKLYN